MSEPFVSATIAAAALVGLVVVTFAALKAWRDWLELQRLGLQGHGYDEPRPANPTGARIELADLKERVRKLEAIAAGVDF